jgi:broad specificity phosphatase PhoE
MDKLVCYVIRHGETSANTVPVFRSWNDGTLDANGFKQVGETADFMKDKPIKQVVCSPLLRAFQTAHVVAKPHGLIPSQTRGLFPWNMGIFCGMPRDENYEALKLFINNPEVKIPDGESLCSFDDRQFAFWKAAFEMSKRRLTAFVTHSSVMTSLVKFTEDIDVDPYKTEIVKPGGVLAVYFDGTNHRVKPVFGMTRPAILGKA